MKVVLACDTHFNSVDLATQVLRWSRMLETAMESGARLILHAGDFIDAHRLVQQGLRPTELLRHLEPPYRRFAASGGRMYVVKGNHDGVDGVEQALFDLRWCRAALFCTPTIVELDDLVVLFLPWNRWRERESLACLSDRLPRKRGRTTILVGHLELAESDTDPSHAMYRQGRFRFRVEDFRTLAVDVFALGHFHQHDSYYLGPFRKTLVEDRDPSGYGFCILDSAHGTIQRYVIDARGTRCADPGQT